jgi:ABC-type uncharacterized transport system permease subunit
MQTLAGLGLELLAVPHVRLLLRIALPEVLPEMIALPVLLHVGIALLALPHSGRALLVRLQQWVALPARPSSKRPHYSVISLSPLLTEKKIFVMRSQGTLARGI